MTDLRGASGEAVERALREHDALPGTTGYAGRVSDGRLVRDVLGRVPLYVDGDDWAFDADALADPEPFPAGHVGTPTDHERAWTLPEPEPIVDDAAAVDAVADAVESACGAVGSTADDLAVAFSGGVDSAVVARFCDAPLHVVGFEGGRDVDAARESAAAMGRADDLTVHELAVEDVERAVPVVARAIGRTDAMSVQIALPIYLVAERIQREGFDRLALGQGADELFGGYAKVAKAPDDPRVDADTVRGARREVLHTLPDQLDRDIRALRAAGVTPEIPLLHDEVVRAALELPDSLLVDGDERKVALRRAARRWLPDRVADRDKVAVQYGSLVARELDRLARQAGFKRRMDDHVTKYVESRIG
ncbi:asparagine synthase C-terminal domain-containing protein [Halocalculus aciditolerans]|uniref:Asparagine synthase n=1 Tax=Halocalculus aciditolerans TaxID=1383812 RepID=A0A830FIT2_9EURY|nr:asparagine synthetase B [Halocalculus aciditolerans]GGL57000.1 asparagine synthase [Halocalculus aciditolerans]